MAKIQAEWVGLVLFTLCSMLGAAAAVQHQVGGTPGWTLPSIGNVNYTVWESTQTFQVGDTLYFNYSKSYHNVMQVKEANYDSCDASTPITTWDDGATMITLNMSGSFYYICGVTGHCGLGQKVAVQVLAAATVKHQVGGAPGWTLPSIGNVNYTLWESTQTFKVGDTLYFNYSKNYHNVMQVTEANYDSCNAASPIAKWDDGETLITLNTSGNFYYICGVTGHCGLGQKVAVEVLSTPVQHQVGGAAGWTLPSIGNVNYTMWESTQTFRVGDTLYFNYSKNYHNVMQVTEANYDSCNAASPIAKWDDGATLITLNTSGSFYYICGVTGHCGLGQKVAVTVLAADASAPSPSSENSPMSSSSALTPAPAPAPASSSTSTFVKPALYNSACTLFTIMTIAFSAFFV